MKKYLWLCAAAILLLAGCGEGGDTDKSKVTPTVTTGVENETVTKAPEATEIPKVTTDVFQSPKKEAEIKQEGLKEVLEKKENPKADKYNAFNRMLSMEKDSGASLFCVDQQTGVIYFVNQNKDCCIYRIKDGEVALAVSMPAKHLWTLDGKLYFMVESYNKYELEAENGDIYCYTPESGTVELVYAAGGIEGSEDHALRVTENGVYFSYSIEIKEEIDGQVFTSTRIYYNHLPFGESEPETDRNRVTLGTEDYYFSYPFVTDDYSVLPDLALVSRMEGTKNMVELGIGRPYWYCMDGEELYYHSGNVTTVCCLNISTRKIKEYDFREALFMTSRAKTEEELSRKIEEHGYVAFVDFMLTEDYLWAAGTMYLYRMDLSTGEVTVYRSEDANCRIDTLYSDGEQLYGLYASSSGGGASVVCIETKEEINPIEYQLDQNTVVKLFRVDYLTE